MRRAWFLLLAVSLLLNFLLLGFGGAVAWRLRHGASGLLEAAMTRTLGPADRRIMHGAFAAAAPQEAAAQARMRTAHLAVDAALRDEPFDPAALQAALETWRADTSGYLATFELPLLQGAGRISPAGRQAMADLGDREVARVAHGAGPASEGQ